MKRLIPVLAGACLLLSVQQAAAREYFVGGPVHQHDMEIVANYLVGVEMAPMLPGMAMGPDVIHLEADVHATADNVYGYPDGAWIAYLTINYTLRKMGSSWTGSGVLHPMEAKDGPHYAENIKMDGPGQYQVTYRFTSPEAAGFLRHTDKETGVPAWWAPFSQDFSFSYPQKYQCPIIHGRPPGLDLVETASARNAERPLPVQQPQAAGWRVARPGAFALRSLVANAARRSEPMPDIAGAVSMARGAIDPQFSQGCGASNSAIGRKVVKGPHSRHR